jgi:signal transduction histidine kinase
VEKVTEKGLDQRIDEVGYEKEFLRLVHMFNEMMARLEKAFYQARRFSADASHELKTPIARLQMELEDALKKSAPESKDQVSYSSLLDELSRLRSIVEKLTLLSSSDKGKLPLALEEVDLGELMARAAEDWEAMAGVRRIEVSVEKSVRIEVDTLLLEQALHNLMSNALKYGAADGLLRLSLSVESTVASLRVWNQGSPIHEADKDKIFDRFFRANSSGGDRSGGGLGLSLAREIARAHNGDVVLERSDGQWTVFRLEIPLAQSETV